MKLFVIIFTSTFLVALTLNVVSSGRQQGSYCISCGEETSGNLTIYNDYFGSARWYKFGYPTFLSRGLHPPTSNYQGEYLLGNPKDFPWEINYVNLAWNLLWMAGLSAFIAWLPVAIMDIRKNNRAMRVKE